MRAIISWGARMGTILNFVLQQCFSRKNFKRLPIFNSTMLVLNSLNKISCPSFCYANKQCWTEPATVTGVVFFETSQTCFVELL